MNSALDAVLDRYVEDSGAVREEAQREFRRVFVQGFREAYEARLLG
jgi:hypothetical protein